MKVIITESQFKKLIESAENLDSPLYHFTYLTFLLGMLKTKTFETSCYDFDYYNARKYGDTYFSDRNRQYICFTRDKMYNVNSDKRFDLNTTYDYLGPQVRIQFNSDFVKGVRNARLQPYAFSGFHDQKEERLYFEKNTGSIPLDTKYIEKIDLLCRFITKKDVPMLMELFNYPEIVSKTRVYYAKYQTSQFDIDRSNGDTIHDDDYKLYMKFLIGDERYSSPLISLKNVLHYFDDDSLSNYKEESYEDKYYNGWVKDENEQWELNKKRKRIVDKILSFYEEADEDGKKKIRKLYQDYKDKLPTTCYYQVPNDRGFGYKEIPDDVGYLQELLSDVASVVGHFFL